MTRSGYLKWFGPVTVLLDVLLIAGCAVREETVALPSYRDWTKVDAKQIANAKPAPEPTLLPVTHFSAGRLFEKQGRYDRAIEQYRKAIELNTRFAAAYNRLGICYMKLGQYDEAVAALTRGVALQPNSTYLHNNLGFAYLIRRDCAQAEACFQRALQIKPAFARARMNLALSLVYQHRKQEALSHLMMLSAEHLAWYNLGQMLLAAGMPADARDAFAKALQCKADFAPAAKAMRNALARLPEPAPTEEAISDDQESQASVARAPSTPATQPSQRASASDERIDQTTTESVAAADAEPSNQLDDKQAAEPIESGASPALQDQFRLPSSFYWLWTPWTVWLGAFDGLEEVDVAELSERDILALLTKWKNALDQLARSTGLSTGATAFAE